MPDPLITDEVVIGNVPPKDLPSGAPGTPVQDRPRTYRVFARATREYTASGDQRWTNAYLRTLPRYIDDVTSDFGDDTYDKMLCDPAVKSALDTIKMGALAEGWRVTPVPDLPDKTLKRLGAAPERQSSPKSQEISDFCERTLNGLSTPLLTVLEEMLDALAFGSKVAEQIYALAPVGTDKGKIVLKALKTKPRTSVAYVVDAYNTLQGLLAMIPGQGFSVLANNTIGQPDKIVNLLPRDKFVVFTWKPRNGDPRGSSQIRAAYYAWWAKQGTHGEHLKNISQFGEASLVGIAAQNDVGTPAQNPDGTTQTNPDGTPVMVTPAEKMTTGLVGFKNGTVIGLPFGADVKVLEAQGDGAVFAKAFDFYNSEISKAILYQTLATNEGEHQARAASEVHQDILTLLLRFVKWCLAETVRRDVLKPLVRYNFGDDAAQALTPHFVLGSLESQDFAVTVTAIANLAKAGYLDASQLPGIDEMLNLPARAPGSNQPVGGSTPDEPDDDDEPDDAPAKPKTAVPAKPSARKPVK